MNKKISLSQLLHNDKLMMVLSAVLAILIWALVVYGPSNVEERVITGVPVSITLNDYASQTLNLRITQGATATATVKVNGLRSVVDALRPEDLTVTADTGDVIKEGTYTLPLRAVSSGDYSIVSIVGTDGNNDTVTISCDSWREATHPIEVEMPGLQVSDSKTYQFGTPTVNDVAVTGGMITVSGPRSDINRISKVVAVISDKMTVRESTSFEASLEARDENSRVIETVSFIGSENSKVKVTVPIMIYRKVSLHPELLNVPAGYAENSSLVTVSPAEVELWGVPSELDEYISSIEKQLVVDFDKLTSENLTRSVTLETVEGIRPVNGSETVTLKVNLRNVSKRTFDIPLSENNVVASANSTLKVAPSQTKLTSITLYGPSSALWQVKPTDVRVVVDMTNATVGNQTLKARLTIPNWNTVWAYYGDESNGLDVLVSVSE